jgi:acetyltransferase-like isoleucine patch superfamily enzyme
MFLCSNDFMLNEIGFARLIKYFIFGLWDLIFQFLPWSPMRVLWMKLFGADVAWSAVVDRVNFMNLDRRGLAGLAIGKKSFVGVAAILDLAGELVIEDQATVSPGAAILTHFSVGFADHPLVKNYPKKVSKTVIGAGAFVGVHATVLAGVKVGENSMVAAGAAVVDNVAENAMVAGVPAILKRKLIVNG